MSRQSSFIKHTLSASNTQSCCSRAVGHIACRCRSVWHVWLAIFYEKAQNLFIYLVFFSMSDRLYIFYNVLYVHVKNINYLNTVSRNYNIFFITLYRKLLLSVSAVSTDNVFPA
jgi:hypothetical protein